MGTVLTATSFQIESNEVSTQPPFLRLNGASFLSFSSDVFFVLLLFSEHISAIPYLWVCRLLGICYYYFFACLFLLFTALFVSSVSSSCEHSSRFFFLWKAILEVKLRDKSPVIHKKISGHGVCFIFSHQRRSRKFLLTLPKKSLAGYSAAALS